MSATKEPPSHERVATIDLGAIRDNVRALAGHVAPAALMSVVKADAYGHGAVPVARAALEGGATWLGCAHVSEALALREAGIDAPLMAWLHTPSTDFDAAVAAELDLGVSGWELGSIVEAARRAGRSARVHLKIDTGLGRNGCAAEDWPALVAAAVKAETEGLVSVVGIFSHLAVADEPQRPETDEQLAAFREAIALAENAGLRPDVRHIANSPAALSRPESRFDLVRIGLAMYGLSPFEGGDTAGVPLRPAMRLSARIAGAKRVKAGQGISYGLKYRTETPTTLGLVPLGYADGLSRLSEAGPVLVRGHVLRGLGRMAMDQFVVDLGADADPADYIGEEAVLFGGRGEPAVEEWAAAAGTINYEVVTRISQRVPRVWIDGAEHGRAAADAQAVSQDA